jgi:hypothetical protein
MRACDAKQVAGIWCVRITAEAGTQKTGDDQTVPLHPHFEALGFVAFARKKKGDAPLFCSRARQRNPDRKTPTYQSVANKLGEWVRKGLGTTIRTCFRTTAGATASRRSAARPA